MVSPVTVARVAEGARQRWDTSRIHPALSEKQRMANARERAREIKGPPPVSKERKVWVTPWQRYQQELFIRARMVRHGELDALAERELLLPLDWYRPGSPGYKGDYQMPEAKQS